MRRRHLLYSGLTLGLALCMACDKNSGEAAPGVSLNGPAQKGPFLEGATVSAWELAPDGSTPGEPITSQVRGGTYSLSGLTWEGPTWVSVEGQVFHELNGDPSQDVYTLCGAFDTDSDEPRAINLYTDAMAHRIRALMADDELDFAQAREQALGEVQATWLTGAAPEQLDIFGGTAGANEDLHLLLYSTATLALGVRQSDWQTLREDFADDGQLNAEGRALHERILESIRLNADELLAQAREHLERHYKELPEAEDDFLVAFSRCMGEKIRDPNGVACAETETRVPASGQAVTLAFYPEVPGLYGAVIYHAGCQEGAYDLDGTKGLLDSVSSSTGVVLEQRSVAGEEPYRWDITASGCDEIGIEPTRYSDGTESDPVELKKGTTWMARGTNEPSHLARTNYYLVRGAPEGTVRLSQYAWDLTTDAARVEVFDADRGWDSSPLATGTPDNIQGFELSWEGAGRDVFIRVRHAGFDAPLTFSEWEMEIF